MSNVKDTNELCSSDFKVIPMCLVLLTMFFTLLLLLIIPTSTHQTYNRTFPHVLHIHVIVLNTICTLLSLTVSITQSKYLRS